MCSKMQRSSVQSIVLREVAESRRRRLAESLEFFPLEVFMELQRPPHLAVSARCCPQQTSLTSWATKVFFEWFCLHKRAKSGSETRCCAVAASWQERASITLRSCRWKCLCVFRICSIMRLTPQSSEQGSEWQAHRKELMEFGVPAHLVSDFFAEGTSAIPRVKREALWCRSNLARFHSSHWWSLWSPHTQITQFITETIKAIDFKEFKEVPSPSGRSTRASSLDMSPGSPKLPALLPYPISPRSTFRTEESLPVLEVMPSNVSEIFSWPGHRLSPFTLSPPVALMGGKSKRNRCQ